MDSSDQILRQLKWIKWLTALIAVSFVVIAGLFAWLVSEAIIAFQEVESSSTSFINRGKVLLEEGNEQEVLKLSAEREKKFPKDPNVHWYRGKAQYQLGHPDEALKTMRHLHELDPSWRENTAPYIKAVEAEVQDADSAPFKERGATLLLEGNEQKVLKLCEEREKQFPKDSYVYWYRGVAHFQLGQFEEALKAMRHVHELEPSWRESTTAPYIKVVEEEIAKGL